MIWIGIAGLYFMDPTRNQWIIAVTIGAVSLELAIWVTALILGVTVFESRKRLWRFLTSPFRRKPRVTDKNNERR